MDAQLHKFIFKIKKFFKFRHLKWVNINYTLIKLLKNKCENESDS